MTKKEIEIEVNEWAEYTCKEHFNVIFYFLFSSKEDRHFAMRLLKRAGRDFKKLVETKTDNERIPVFYEIYSKNYEQIDAEVRFGEEEDKLFAMWIKMNALGMTYEEIVQDSKRRDAWTQLNEKRKGKW